MRSNVHELPAFVTMAHEFHADEVDACHIIPVTTEGKDELLIDDPERYAHFHALATARAEELGLKLRAPSPFVPSAVPSAVAGGNGHTDARSKACGPEGIRCAMPTEDIYVFYDGRVFPCCHPYAHSKMFMGDLRTQTFAEIWNGIDYRNLRRGLAQGDVLAICRNCSIVHDPPPVHEDAEAAERGPDITSYYAGRDLDPLDTESTPNDFLGSLVDTGVSDYVALLHSHVENLEDIRCHSENLEAERSHLLGHIENLEAERPHLVGHIEALEEERRQLLGHVDNLERIVRKTRAEAIYRACGRIKDIFRPHEKG
jgi:radical SAM protein with 4Fe4S-binding SPASM domain